MAWNHHSGNAAVAMCWELGTQKGESEKGVQSLRQEPLSGATEEKGGQAMLALWPLYLGRLCGHLDAGLQDGDGEVGVRAGAEPEAEGRVRVLHLQLFYQLVQMGHPR